MGVPQSRFISGIASRWTSTFLRIALFNPTSCSLITASCGIPKYFSPNQTPSQFLQPGASLLFPAFSPQECLKALVYFEDESLRDLPRRLEERLLSAIKSVRSIPTAALNSPSLND
jgi:hypothetical protein